MKVFCCYSSLYRSKKPTDEGLYKKLLHPCRFDESKLKFVSVLLVSLVHCCSDQLLITCQLPNSIEVRCCLQILQYISDTGGVLGLWFGFAVMTFVEFFEMSVDLLLLAIIRLVVNIQSCLLTRKSAT